MRLTLIYQFVKRMQNDVEKMTQANAWREMTFLTCHLASSDVHATGQVSSEPSVYNISSATSKGEQSYNRIMLWTTAFIVHMRAQCEEFRVIWSHASSCLWFQCFTQYRIKGAFFEREIVGSGKWVVSNVRYIYFKRSKYLHSNAAHSVTRCHWTWPKTSGLGSVAAGWSQKTPQRVSVSQLAGLQVSNGTWNSLPSEATSSATLSTFKHELKTYLFSPSFPGT